MIRIRFASRYAVSVLGLATMAGLWLGLRKPDDHTDYWWFLPGVFLVPLVAFLLWSAAQRIRAEAPRRLRIAIGLSERDRTIDDLRHTNSELAGQLQLVPAQVDSAYVQGLAEGIRRVVGLEAGRKAKSFPVRVIAVGGPALHLLADCTDPHSIVPYARFTLAAAISDVPLGVLEVVHVTKEGQVVLVCVDRVLGDYWEDLDHLTPAESRSLPGTHLIAYNLFEHHALAPPTVPLGTLDSRPPKKETE